MTRAKPTSSPKAGSPFVRFLATLGRGDLDVAGGKGANLGELVQAGFPIPGGFVVTTDAYQSFVANNGLEAVVARALQAGDGDGLPVRSAFERAPIPPGVEQDLLTALRRLGPGPVAVRSSATAEDLPEAAFAGQQDTYLNIIGEEALLDATRRCWASLWTDRAIAYRARQGLAGQPVKLAVVVQRMVEAEAAGVMFTANPVTGARDEVVIDASPGLGEAVVSGLVTPDHVVLRRHRWGTRIAERRAGLREVAARSIATGGTEHVSPGASRRPAVPNRVLYRLETLGRRIERRFGCPQDIEWAWDGKAIHVLQARPITAMPEPVPRPNAVVRMVAGVFSEILAVRPYPMDLTTWDPALLGAITPMLNELGLGMRPIDELLVEEDGVVTGISGRFPLYPTWRLLGAPWRLLRNARRYDPATWQADPDLALALGRMRELEARVPRDLAWGDLLATLRETIAMPVPLAGEPRRRYFPRAALAAVRLRGVLAVLGLGDRLVPLLSGVETKTLETNRGLEALAAEIRRDAALADVFATREPAEIGPALETSPAGRAFKERLGAFLERYGHREAVVGTAYEPTWKDAPEVVLCLLKGLARSEVRIQTGPLEWEKARDELLAHPWMRHRVLRLRLLKWLADARWLLRIREDTHFNATMPLPVVRRLLLELGERLVGAGALMSPADVFHLTLDEIEPLHWPPSAPEAEHLRALVERRRARRSALAGRPLVDPRLFKREETGENVLVSGTPGSPGLAEGPVCVIRDGSEFGKLRPGDILVAPFTNPAWTPLFQRAAAVVVDSGGAGSHAAIVAREYGIPAVMGTVDGTRRLVDGERVRVDGAGGWVLPGADRQG